MSVIDSFYDIMAWLIRLVLDNSDEPFFEKYSALTFEQTNKINEELEKHFPELLYQKQIQPVIDFQKYDELFFQRIKQFAEKDQNEFQLQKIVSLLSKLDILLSFYIQNYSSEEEKRGLNFNINDTHIQLLPRTKCFWEHDRRGADYSNCLLNYLHYFYYIDSEKLGTYEVWNRFLAPNTFWHAEKRKFLRIGVSPLSNQGKLEWHTEIKNGTQYFSINKVENIDIIEENVLAIVDEAKKQGVDILVMPEMLGSYHIRKSVADKLSEFPENDESYPALTVLPSIWEAHQNTVIVLDEYGDEVIRQEKQHPFMLKNSEEGNCLENINPDRKIHLIHCEGIGRIAIMVCKDALMKDYLHMVLTVLKVTLLIIPSFSTGNYNFKEIIQYCRVADCCAFWINTCSVAITMGLDDKKLKNIGFALKAGKRPNDPNMENGLFLCERKSQGCENCGIAGCNQCMFIHDLVFGKGG